MGSIFTATSELYMNPWQQVIRSVELAWRSENWMSVGVVIGCSGGADSVCLLRALAEITERNGASGFLLAAHFNHGLRGAESDGDADFVRQLASDLGLSFVSENAKLGGQDEASMRDSRIAFLRETAQQTGARYVAVAHSSDDQVETLLHQLFRGTGPKGLCGIAPFRAMGEDVLGQDLVLARPLLNASRELIRSAMIEIGQSWREDSSNENTDYRRNWIRQKLLPLIRSEFPSAELSIGRLIESQREWKTVMDQAAENWIQRNAEMTTSHIKLRRMSGDESAIIVHALQAIWLQRQWPQAGYTSEHWIRLVGSLQSSKQERYNLPGNVDARCGRQWIELHR